MTVTNANGVGEKADRSFQTNAGRERDIERDRDERGFFDRMGDEFRSWFGDDESQRRRQWSRDDNWESRGSA